MKFRIQHTTRYDYARAVNLAPHILRLHPRTDAHLLLQEYHCKIEPEPQVSNYCLDYADNVILRVEFTTPTRELIITSSFVATTIANDSELPAMPAELPVNYSEEEVAHLAAYRQVPVLDESAQSLMSTLVRESQGDPLQFLQALNAYIYTNIQREIRDLGLPQTPQQTLTRHCGACRDLAVLFMTLCRAQGFAARFVSGYQAKAEVEHGQRYMHAWPEVYVPGVGWRGYDPTHATRVQDAHVAVTTSHTSTGAAPVEGSYYNKQLSQNLHSISVLMSVSP